MVSFRTGLRGRLYKLKVISHETDPMGMFLRSDGRFHAGKVRSGYKRDRIKASAHRIFAQVTNLVGCISQEATVSRCWSALRRGLATLLIENSTYSVTGSRKRYRGTSFGGSRQ
jgi:hypothetical protein